MGSHLSKPLISQGERAIGARGARFAFYFIYIELLGRNQEWESRTSHTIHTTPEEGEEMNDQWMIGMRTNGEPLWYTFTDDGRVYWAMKHENALRFARRGRKQIHTQTAIRNAVASAVCTTVHGQKTSVQG